MAFSSRNHLKIQEHVGLPLEICSHPRFMALRSTLNSLIPKISGGPISPEDLLFVTVFVPLINCAKWSLSRIRVD